MNRILCSLAIVAMSLFGVSWGQERPADPETIPAIKAFLGDGFGVLHEQAPDELQQFGRLVGLWRVEAEMARQGGGWVKSQPGIWVWKYTIDGFAVTDLWYQGADRLPAYMAALGRDYLLTANRVYDVANKKWQVAWMANGAGKTPGVDFGVFAAQLEDEEIVMRSLPGIGFGLQRVVFFEITDESFRWKSEYSMDEGETWNTVMRMKATRYAR